MQKGGTYIAPQLLQCAAHLRRHSTNFSVFKIICRESSAADVLQRSGTHSCAGTGTAVIRRSENGRPSNQHRSGTTRLQCRGSICLERPACWTWTVPQHCYIQTTPKDTSVYLQLGLVTPYRHQRLCVIRLHGVLQMLLLLLLLLSSSSSLLSLLL